MYLFQETPMSSSAGDALLQKKNEIICNNTTPDSLEPPSIFTGISHGGYH